jgi:hypothetical protein
MSRACETWPKAFDFSTCSLMSALSSLMVSNWLAIWAKSSSASGSSRSLTASSVTETSAFSPALSPPISVDSNEVDSPAVRVSSASSMPSMSSPDPIS